MDNTENAVVETATEVLEESANDISEAVATSGKDGLIVALVAGGLAAVSGGIFFLVRTIKKHKEKKAKEAEEQRIKDAVDEGFEEPKDE